MVEQTCVEEEIVFVSRLKDHLAVADTLGVNRSTDRSIVAKYNRGGLNNIKVDEEMKDCLNEIVNENCLLGPVHTETFFLRFCIVSSNELVVLASHENSKQYKNAGKRFPVHRALTLKQINEELRGRLPDKPPVSDRTIAKTLNGMLIRVKLARPVPADRNRPDVVERRYEYVNWFMIQAFINHCVYIDECGYNIWTARCCGGL